MFNRATILAYSRYFLGHLQPYLTKTGEAKVVESDLATVSIEDIFARGISIWGISIEGLFLEEMFLLEITM